MSCGECCREPGNEAGGARRGEGLFDVATWPTASIETTGFQVAGKGFRAQAKLKLRDVFQDVVLPFALEIAEDPNDTAKLTARASGERTVSRLDYGVG